MSPIGSGRFDFLRISCSFSTVLALVPLLYVLWLNRTPLRILSIELGRADEMAGELDLHIEEESLHIGVDILHVYVEPSILW